MLTEDSHDWNEVVIDGTVIPRRRTWRLLARADALQKQPPPLEDWFQRVHQNAQQWKDIYGHAPPGEMKSLLREALEEREPGVVHGN